MQTDENMTGDMPTTGGARPGPVAMIEATADTTAAPRSTTGARPVVLRIPSIQVDAEVERAFIVDGAMQDPSGPFVVAWYGQTERVGVRGTRSSPATSTTWTWGRRSSRGSASSAPGTRSRS
jgi:hypothetical protein